MRFFLANLIGKHTSKTSIESISGLVRVTNYREYLSAREPKFALLSYLSQPILDHLNGNHSVRFSNDGLATSWAKILNRCGYVVDIINWEDKNFKFREKYDLVISHGGVNFLNILRQLSSETRYIYFSTGSYWSYHNTQEEKRFNDFKKRHGIALPWDRSIESSEEDANRLAEAIICLGNKKVADTYKSFKSVYCLPIGSFTMEGHVKTLDEIESGRKNILFVAGAGNIHKGLDVVLDAIKSLPDFHLYIYSFMDKYFSEYYKDILSSPQVTVFELEAFPNDTFINLTKKCNIAVMPSCSEGSPGSIVEAMIQGLIPVVSEESHIDVDDFGEILRNNQVSTIKNTLKSLSVENAQSLLKRSHSANRIGTSRHSRKSFEDNLEQILKDIGV